MEIEPTILQQIDRQFEQETDDLSIRYKRLRNFFKLCESPLEQKLLFHVLTFAPGRLSRCTTGYDELSSLPTLMCWQWDVEDFHTFAVKIIAQHIILKKDGVHHDRDRAEHYRTDFLFELIRDRRYIQRPDDNGQLWRISEIYSRLVVEIDGHNFHERTKEQAKRDRSRDRYMTTEGYTVFRFTGSEVHNNPYDVAHEIEEYFAKIMVKVERGEMSPLDLQKGDKIMMSAFFELKRYVSKDFGRKHVHGI